jgi:hypothetical protein
VTLQLHEVNVMLNFLRKPIPAALALTMMAGSANAAVLLSNELDGHWWNPDQGGRGVLIDFIPTDVGRGVMFAALYTYDAGGNPEWLIVQSDPVADNQTTIAAQIGRSVGGRFGADHNPAAVATTAIGSATFTVNGCNSITLQLAPNANSGFPAATYELSPFLGNGGECQPIVTQCPAGTTADGPDCALPGSIAGTLNLPAGKKYLINGAVFVESGGVLNISPGVVLEGGDTAVPDFLAVKAGGKIFANGTRSQPITFTGPEPVPGSWAGVVLNGFSNCNESTQSLGCSFEAIPELVFGGNNVNDSSGSMRYVRILWAGEVIRDDEELNSLTMNGVGAGTTLEYIQVHGGLDDGFEWFGGTVNGRYLVATQVGDDGFDCDDGFQGKVQYGLMWQGSENGDQGGDSNGLECDNDQGSPNVLPRTKPTFSNITYVGSANGNEGMRIRRGSGGIHHNVLVTGFTDHCVNIDDAATAALFGTDLVIRNSFIGTCGAGALEDANGVNTSELWNAAGTNNRIGNPMLDGFMPMPGSPVLTGGQAPNDPFFTPTNYVGAFDGQNDWTAGWIYNPGAQ